MLFQEGESLFLSVLCGGVAQFTVDILLTEAERARYQVEGRATISGIASAVCQSPGAFDFRRLVQFENMAGVEQATREWRNANSVA
jgi:hypothetical protein